MKYKEFEKLSKEDLEKKLAELKLELIKSKVSSTKTGNSKPREIRKMIAQILTLKSSSKLKQEKKTN